MTRPPTRVVVVEDSATQRAFLRRSLEADGDIIVVGEAATAASAVAAVLRGEPDVVTVDLDIPGGGHAAIERIMKTTPRPILVLTGSSRRSPDASRALGAGAAAIAVKPLRWDETSESDLRRRVKNLRGLRMVPKVAALAQAPSDGPRAFRPAAPMAPRATTLPPQILALAASTGGPGALAEVLRGVAGLDVPVVCVQHIGAQSVNALARWLAGASGWPVDIAAGGEPLTPGRVILGPPGMHLTVTEGGRVSLVEEPVTAHRPSADVLFESLARTMGPATIAVILTGMGNDGAAGLLALRKAGALTIAQDEETSAVFGMAKAAIDLGAARHVVPLGAVGLTIRRMTRGVF